MDPTEQSLASESEADPADAGGAGVHLAGQHGSKQEQEADQLLHALAEEYMLNPFDR